MIKIESLSAGYGSGDVIKGVSASFEQGMITSIIGPNGCGKSTLLKAVAGLITPSSGSVSVDGVSLSKMKPQERAKRISYLPQTRRLPHMTVFELILHGRFPHLSFPRVYGKRDHKAAEEAAFRMGLTELSDRPLSTLSGGILQKAYVAMALAQSTDHILLDEATTHLDVSHSFRLMDILKNLKEDGHSVVTVLHDLPLAMTYSDTVIVMNEGKIVSAGTPCEIMSSGIIRDVFGVGLEMSHNTDTPSCYYVK